MKRNTWTFDNDKLDRINAQIKILYGPLYILTQSINHVRQTFYDEFDSEDGYRDEYRLEKWSIWLKTVFIPVNKQIYDLIISNMDLLIETETPLCIVDFCAHTICYRPVSHDIELSKVIDLYPLIRYPPEFNDYCQQSLYCLKQEQAKLLSRSQL